MEARLAALPSQLRWLLVIPAFLVGFFIPGFLARISWEFSSSWIPGFDFLTMRFAEFIQPVVDGFCSVYFAGAVAPRGVMAVSIAAATIVAVATGGILAISFVTNYYRDVEPITVIWNSGLMVVTVASAAFAVWLRHEQERPSATNHAHTDEHDRSKLKDYDSAQGIPMPRFGRKPEVTLDKFCRDFYNKDILHAVILDTDIHIAYCNQVRKSVAEADPSFASVDMDTLVSEFQILRFEVFAEAWVHELSSHKLAKQLLLLQTLFTKKYLQEEGRLDIWEGMEPYNQAIAEILFQSDVFTPDGRAYYDKMYHMRARLWNGWCEQGFDEECAERASNRMYPDETWEKFITPWNLMLVLQDRVNCEVNEEAQTCLTYFIRGLYDGAREAIREVDIVL
jgi:hypothetical protein